jgi:hypothetical protein
MADKSAIPGIASYDRFDAVEDTFTPEAPHTGTPAAAKAYDRRNKKRDARAASFPNTEIDLTDPAEVAEAVARFRLVTSSLHTMAAEKVRLEARLAKKSEQIEVLKAELAEARNALKAKEEVLSFADRHHLALFSLKGGAFGAAATIVSLAIIGYLF